MGYRVKGTMVGLSTESWEMLCTLAEAVGTSPQGLAGHLLNGMLERLQVIQETSPEGPGSPEGNETGEAVP